MSYLTYKINRMGTNYYAYRLPKEEEKQELIKAIQNNDFNLVNELHQDFFGMSDEYSQGGIYHIGKRSSGWSFKWNSQVRTEWVDGKATSLMLFPLTKQGLLAFYDRPDIIIKDEYGKIIPHSEFFDMAFSWKGIDSETYYKTHPDELSFGYLHDKHTIDKFARIGFFPRYHDFISDGLLFSVDIVFS